MLMGIRWQLMVAGLPDKHGAEYLCTCQGGLWPPSGMVTDQGGRGQGSWRFFNYPEHERMKAFWGRLSVSNMIIPSKKDIRFSERSSVLSSVVSTSVLQLTEKIPAAQAAP